LRLRELRLHAGFGSLAWSGPGCALARPHSSGRANLGAAAGARNGSKGRSG
jgi:hypothetical protein